MIEEYIQKKSADDHRFEKKIQKKKFIITKKMLKRLKDKINVDDHLK